MPASNDRPVATFDHLKAKPPLEVTDWLAVNHEAAADVRTAQAELDRLNKADPPDPEGVAAAQARLDAAEELFHLPENSIEVRFRNPGSAVWKKIKAAHPPTDEQAETFKQRNLSIDYNPDTIGPDIISAAMVQPALTPEQVAELYESPNWGEAELTHLLSLALAVTTVRRIGGNYRFS